MSGMKLTGLRCQCTECGRVFSRTSSFDAHRTGDYGKDRRCMTEEEMLAKGMQSTDGVWRKASGGYWGALKA